MNLFPCHHAHSLSISVLTWNTRRWRNDGLMLGQRRRRWPNIKPWLGQCLLFYVSSIKLIEVKLTMKSPLFFIHHLQISAGISAYSTLNELMKKWIVFRPPLCTYRLNYARITSWGWWDESDNLDLQTQDSKYEPWPSITDSPQYWIFTSELGRNICFFESWMPERGTSPHTSTSRQAALTTIHQAPANLQRWGDNVSIWKS